MRQVSEKFDGIVESIGVAFQRSHPGLQLRRYPAAINFQTGRAGN